MPVGKTPAGAPDPASDREILITRTLDAPRSLVWKAWTDPAHVARWWGPDGFTTTTHEHDLRPGGVWRYTMHGPDGTDYANKTVYTEVVDQRRLVYTQTGGHPGGPGVKFECIVTFDDDGDRTRVTLRSVFPSASARDECIREYHADEGAKQHLARLAAHLAAMDSRSNAPGTGPTREFKIERVFDAPRALVWKVWTEREHLMRWFGPKGVTIPSCTLDLRPGGVFLYCIRPPAGQYRGKDMWGKWIFREIRPPERLVFVSSFSDEGGGITRHPLAPDWPREMLSTVTFSEHAGKGGGTLVTVRWSPIDPTEAERKTFDAGQESMRQGWTGTFEQFAEYLRTVK